MGKDLIGYNALVEAGLRAAVREALDRVAREGWPGSHHAYITFRTDTPGVEVPDVLRGRYPDELTIVLQHQFWDLDVGETSFSVTLSFNKVSQRITVPFAALTSYADPSVKFGLQFGPGRTPAADAASGPRPAPAAAAGADAPEAGAAEAGAEDGAEDAAEAEAEKVVTLDRFRKK